MKSCICPRRRINTFVTSRNGRLTCFPLKENINGSPGQ
ncbi:hypothetical protein T01_10329 [Trichinella spiralis]|uniref:Uncharacterized protein n=1 Tax=Trichinella spiralis TaxID=6334 RepID=A0A0V1A380_TRISP|nr:hypothetical protein T01_10329 [Trichinella spiralis]